MSDFDSIAKQVLYERDALRPTFKTWLKHIFFLLLTLCTSTIAGTLYPFGKIDILPTDAEPQTWTEIYNFILSLPFRYVGVVTTAVTQLLTNGETLRYGLSFSLSLLFILICHEMGHYVACRIYRVDATLPFFLPTPPMVGPAGTFGAFIKILSPIPSRKATFDIGVAGPIAGFIALIPITFLAFLTYKPLSDTPLTRIPEGTLIFSEPLFLKIFYWIFNLNPQIPMEHNPFYCAAWVGLLVTALNLFPSGQLDGGHAVYSVFGAKIHRLTGIIAFVVMAVLSVLGWVYFNSPSGFLFVVILGIMMRIGHPEPYDSSPLDFKRNLIAFLTLLIFILSFSPFPIKIS